MQASRQLARLAILAVSALATAAAARAETTLRWKFTEGKTHAFTTTQTTKDTAKIAGQEFKTETTQVMDLSWKVGSVAPDGTAEMTQTIDRIRITASSAAGEKFAFDSADEADAEGLVAQVGPILRALVGAPVTLKITPRGEIGDVKIPAAVLDALRKATPAAAAGAGELVSEEGIKRMIRQMSLVLPAEPVAKGTSWSSDITIDVGPETQMVMTNMYLYAGPASYQGTEVEKIDLKVAMQIRQPEKAPAKVAVKALESTGGYFFDNASGFLRGAEMDQTLELTISAQGMDLTKRTDTSIRFAPKEPAP